MRFRVLGPIEAWNEDDRIDVRGSKMRTVLASLLLSNGRAVSDARLIEMLWGANPPSTTQAQIQTYASRLRALLGDEVRIERAPRGYRLDIAPSGLDLDLKEFEQLAAEGHLALAAGQMPAAAAALRKALALWKGQALSGVTDHLAAVEQPRIEEARLTALEDLIDAELAMGEHVTLVTELTALVAEHPLRERPRAQLMLALYRCGRVADALANYQDYRGTLAEELGLDPSLELQTHHQAILAGDATLSLARPLPPPTMSVLASEPGDFTGRRTEAEHVRRWLTAPDGHPGPAQVVAITGMPGAGKTSLALHVARRLRDHTPHRQIRVDLGGSTAHPTSPRDALARLLVALGVDERETPRSLDQQIGHYRSALTSGSTLLLLDDAADAQQIRPLLPNVTDCMVLVTSRSHLADLEGTARIELGPLSPDESVELLSRIVGADRAAREEPAARRIADMSSHLPLALRISGARLAARPHWPLARLADRLTSRYRLLDELQFVDLDVTPGLEWSLGSVRPYARGALISLARAGLPYYTAQTVSELLGCSLDEAHDLSDELIEAHLVALDEDNVDRYRIPALVSALAARHESGHEAADTLFPPLFEEIQVAQVALS